jgi:hypothetical protein
LLWFYWVFLLLHCSLCWFLDCFCLFWTPFLFLALYFSPFCSYYHCLFLSFLYGGLLPFLLCFVFVMFSCSSCYF